MLRVALVFVVLFAAMCSPAAAQYDDNPAAVAVGANDFYVFARAGDGTVLARHLPGGDWQAVPGLIASSGPAAVAYDGTVQLFARGPGAGELWQATLQDGRWSAWVMLPGATTSAPSVGRVRGTNRLVLAARGINNEIKEREYDPRVQRWTDWQVLDRPETFAAAPAVGSYVDGGSFELFAPGTDGKLYLRYWDTTQNAWYPYWYNPPGTQPVAGASAVVSRSSGQFDLVVRGPDGILKHRYFSVQTSWTEWTVVDARPVESSAALTSDDPNRLTLFARAGDELLMKTWNLYPGATWGGWTSLGKIALPAPVDPGLPPAPADADGDGVLDAADRCASVAGAAMRAGCPKGLLADPSIRYRPVRRGIRVVAYYVKATTGSRVVVSCSRGCRRSVVTGRGSRTVRIKALNARTLKNGTKITVRASLAGRLTTTVVDRVSKGRRVEGRATCVPVGC
jgi:hypothetical protein